jgi:hypothetical protein
MAATVRLAGVKPCLSGSSDHCVKPTVSARGWRAHGQTVEAEDGRQRLVARTRCTATALHRRSVPDLACGSHAGILGVAMPSRITKRTVMPQTARGADRLVLPN